MHLLLHILAQSGSTTSTTTKSTSRSGSSTYGIVLIILIVGGIYFLFMRPRQKRLRQQQSASKVLAVGDPVVTIGGIQGTLVAIDNDVAEVEVSPGVVLTMLRRAVNPRPDATGTAAATAPPVDDGWSTGSAGANGAPPVGTGPGSGPWDDDSPAQPDDDDSQPAGGAAGGPAAGPAADPFAPSDGASGSSTPAPPATGASSNGSDDSSLDEAPGGRTDPPA
jgi:preprotein translocase subunit YajC